MKRWPCCCLLLVMSLTFVPAMPSSAASPQNPFEPPNPYVSPFGMALAPPMYLVNFLLLYFSNPETAAYMPAYRVPLPQPVYQCLFESKDNSCPYDDMAPYLAQQALVSGGSQNKTATWPASCQTDPRWQNLAPPLYRQPDQINQPLGQKTADQIAQLLGITQDMVLTDDEYACMIATPVAGELISLCSSDLSSSTGNADIPLSSYGMYINENGDVRSTCAPYAPCLEFNKLFAGPLEVIAERCGFADKLKRFITETPFLKFAQEAAACQNAWEPACIVEASCPGNGAQSNNSCAPSLANPE